MQSGKGKEGINVVEYGDPTSTTILGYIEPARGTPSRKTPSYIVWYDKNGDLFIHPEREESGAVIGLPIHIRASGNYEHDPVMLKVIEMLMREDCDHDLKRNDRPEFKSPNWTCEKCGRHFRHVAGKKPAN